MFTYSPEPLRLGLFDLGGVLYHANYFAVLEQAREAFLRENDIPYPTLADKSQHLAIVESNQQFRQPIRYGQELSVHLRAEKIRETSLVLHYNIAAVENPEHSLHIAWTKLVFIDSVAGTLKPSKMPTELKTAFKSILG